jgi:hypothetical protein
MSGGIRDLYLFRFEMIVFGFGIWFEFNLNKIKFEKVKCW